MATKTRSKGMANPLSDEDLENLSNAQSLLKQASTALIKANQAGVDTGELEQRVKFLADRLTALKRTYSTG